MAIRHSRGYNFSILQGPETDLREWNRCVHAQKNRKPYQKDTFFLWKKYFEDARQDEKHVPDLLEAIIPPPGPVKEELRQKLFKTIQFEPKITKMKVCTFQMSGKIRDSTNVAFEAVISIPFLRYLAALAAKYSKNDGFKRLQSLFTVVCTRWATF